MVAGDQLEQDAQSAGYEHGAESDGEGDARAIDGSAEDVSPEMVGPQRIFPCPLALPAGRDQAPTQRLIVGIMEGEKRRAESAKCHREDDHAPEDSRLALP